jgi:hypothetical protein
MHNELVVDEMKSEKFESANSSLFLDEWTTMPAHSGDLFSNEPFRLPKLPIKNIKRSNKQPIQESSNFVDDWSKESLEQFFQPVESFLDKQLKREKSSKRRCKELARFRTIEQNRMEMEDRLKEFDNKICLNVLLRTNREFKSKSLNSVATGGSGGGETLLNYRQMIALGNHKASCPRCIFFNNCYEENNLVGLDDLKKSFLTEKGAQQGGGGAKKTRRLRLPKLPHHQLNSQLVYANAAATANVNGHHMSRHHRHLNENNHSFTSNEASFSNLSKFTNSSYLK